MKQPNIIFILPDQFRADYIDFDSSSFVKTPTIDSLAEQGTKFNNVVSPCPLCVPARSAILTGITPEGNGIIDNLSWLRPDHEKMGIKTWPTLLSEIGYKTTAIGKMHFYPWDENEGFDERIIAEDKRHINIEDDYYYDLAKHEKRKQHGLEQELYQEFKGASINDLPDELQVDRWVANKSCDYIKNYNDERPFALMVGFPGPHCPYDPPAESLDRIDTDLLPAPFPPTQESISHLDEFIQSYKRPWAQLDYDGLTSEHISKIRQHYCALVERMDEDIARILEALKSSGKLDNSIVIFASDHGDYLGDFKLVGKTYFHESSIKIPLVIRDFREQNPQKEEREDQRAIYDIFPTILQYAGYKQIPEYADGISLARYTPDRVIFGMTNYGVMARDSQYKLVMYKNGAKALYDIINDPKEQTNLVDNLATKEVVKKLETEVVKNMIDGFTVSNFDKKVPQCQAPKTHDFFKPNWHREYPNKY